MLIFKTFIASNFMFSLLIIYFNFAGGAMEDGFRVYTSPVLIREKNISI